MTHNFGKSAVPVAPMLTVIGSLSRLWDRLRLRRGTAAARSDQLHILVSALRRDNSGRHSAHVLNSLRAQFALTKGNGTSVFVAVQPETLAGGPVETPHALVTAEARGRKWLRTRRAELLIWGEVGAEEATVRLRFVAMGAPGVASGGQLHSVPPPGEIAELVVPAGFGADYAALLATITLLGIEPRGAAPHPRLAKLLAAAIARLRPLADEPPAHFTLAQCARLWQTYALGERRLDGERSDNTRLDAAVANFRKLLEVWTREHEPQEWAAAQAALGEALLRLAEREADIARLEDAVDAFRAALTVHTRIRVPQDWASLQHNTGVALWRLGEYTAGTERLEEAAGAFRAALEERSRDQFPKEWADTQSCLAAALAALGAREPGKERLQQAVGAYRDLLRTSERLGNPLEWAAAQNNLGVALVRLGINERSGLYILEGIAAFRAALTVRTRQRAPLEWAATQNNLGAAMAVLGAYENSKPRLKEAMTVINAALRVFNREATPLEWAGAQNNLGSVLASLGERDSGTGPMEEAVAAYRAALQEYTRPLKPLQWSEIQEGLGATIAYLGEPGDASVKQREAAATRQTWAREHVPLDRALTQHNLGMALLTLAARQARVDPEQANRTLVAAREVMIGALEGRHRGGTAAESAQTQASLAEIDAALAKLGFPVTQVTLEV